MIVTTEFVTRVDENENRKKVEGRSFLKVLSTSELLSFEF
ncbi:hypothetical protein DBT_0186 [Dissulfuribacter thermophilus]|uniref:Uncharacterized protein n=1 Tax=Dissulfuribacter thermophilus TaxID=1156395 RepID=A0A1B9F8X6_9BACT|nr:hypothetical protein DBT_0186 [Dissulfuribacter thermophilus]